MAGLRHWKLPLMAPRGPRLVPRRPLLLTALLPVDPVALPPPGPSGPQARRRVRTCGLPYVSHARARLGVMGVRDNETIRRTALPHTRHP